MSDNEIRYYVLITPDQGIQVVGRQWFDFPDHYNGTFLEPSFGTQAEAQYLANEITLSVLRAELIRIGAK